MLAFRLEGEPATESAAKPASRPATKPAPSRPASPAAESRGAVPDRGAGEDWGSLVERLGLQGPASQLAQHCTLRERDGSRFVLLLEPDGEHFRRPQLVEKLTQALSNLIGAPATLQFELADAPADTPARRRAIEADERQRAAQEAIENDPNVRALKDVFNARVQPDSIKPVN
jgi:DNA polymerase-3 subunit gamma/tau